MIDTSLFDYNEVTEKATNSKSFNDAESLIVTAVTLNKRLNHYWSNLDPTLDLI